MDSYIDIDAMKKSVPTLPGLPMMHNGVRVGTIVDARYVEGTGIVVEATLENATNELLEKLDGSHFHVWMDSHTLLDAPGKELMITPVEENNE